MPSPEPPSAPDPPPGHHPSAASNGALQRRKRNRSILVASLATALVALGWLLLFGLNHDPTEVRSPLVGRAAPAFDLPTLEGSRSVDLSDLRGQVVVLNFWASWCTECRLEHPNLEAAWQRYRDQGVVFLGVPFNDAVAASKGYAREEGGDWPLVQDPGSRVALAYGVSGVPETFFISRDGRVVDRVIGPVSYERLTDAISRLIEAGAS